MSESIYLECIHCKHFYSCTLKETKVTDSCLNFEEREGSDNGRTENVRENDN